jgi:hypothetical protein
VTPCRAYASATGIPFTRTCDGAATRSKTPGSHAGLLRPHPRRTIPGPRRFRSFLLNSCKFFLADQADRTRAQKRGAGAILPFDVASREQQYRFEPLHNKTPKHIFERSWAIALIDRVVSYLRDEFVQHGSLDDFEKLKGFLLGQAEIPYIELAREMNATEGGLKVIIHRLRKRYRILFLREIAETVFAGIRVDRHPDIPLGSRFGSINRTIGPENGTTGNCDNATCPYRRRSVEVGCSGRITRHPEVGYRLIGPRPDWGRQ